MLLNLNKKVMSADGVTEHPLRPIRRRVKQQDGSMLEVSVGTPMSFLSIIYPKLSTLGNTQAKEDSNLIFDLLLKLGKIKQDSTTGVEFTNTEVALMYKYAIQYEDIVVVGRWNELTNQ